MPPESSRDLLAYTPMIHSRLFTQTAKFRDHNFQPIRSGLQSLPPPVIADTISDLYLDGNPSVDRPLFVQFCANSPDELLEAARYVAPFCDAVDLNLGCPQAIARKGRYGAFLQEDWDLVYKLINKLYENLDVPVTAKVRILETKEKTLEYAKVILSAGASILTLHGRQRDQKGHNTGLADWSVIRYLRENLPQDTVIFANGNILQHEDIERCMQETGADGVMSAEGNLYNPAIFAKPPEVGCEGRDYWRAHDQRGGYRVDAVFRRYMDILYQYVLEQPPPKRMPLFVSSNLVEANLPSSNKIGESKMINECSARKRKHDEAAMDATGPAASKEAIDKKNTKKQKHGIKQTKTTSPNLLSMQAHLFHLLRPLVSKHTNVRDSLARCRAGDMVAYENVLSLVEEAVKEGLLDYESDPSKYEEDQSVVAAEEQKEYNESMEASSLAAVKACKRPYWVCQPYVRPLPNEALKKGSLTLGKKDRKVEETFGSSGSKSLGNNPRETLDKANGMPSTEMPIESSVCG